MSHKLFSNGNLQQEFEKWIKLDNNDELIDFVCRFYNSMSELSIRIQNNEDLDRLFSYFINPRVLMKLYSDLCISVCKINNNEDRELVDKLVEEAVLMLFYDHSSEKTLISITNGLIASKSYDPVYMKIRRFNDELLTIDYYYQ